MEDSTFVNNHSEKRFEYKRNGSLAFIEYEIKDDRILLISTQVPEEISGQGVGSELIKQSFEQIENMNLKVVPVCSFVQNWLRKNPEKQHILA
ncbi:MAG: GNAT family N-acetyltransferase [Bacteroidales bacterium]|jgi:predicted GNAT family acetyltransferase|nr:GNAT family N-acetyltransferase [Bacteroidales bacterium]